VSNYNARKIVMRFNEIVAKAAEERGRKIESEVTQRLTAHFTRYLAEKEAALEQKLQKQLKKSQSNVDSIWNFFTR